MPLYMQRAIHKPTVVALLIFLAAAPFSFAQQSKHGKQDSKEKTVWGYDGGVFFETDGSLPNGVCFRITGRMSAGEFFDGLKRIDTDQATTFRRGTQTLTQFPDTLTVVFSIRDELCPGGLKQVGTRVYMTQKMIDELHISIYWKHGVDLMPVKGVKEINARIDRILPYATALTAELPPRYQWLFEVQVPSAGVPLMDSLAFVFRIPDGRIAARVAARL